MLFKSKSQKSIRYSLVLLALLCSITGVALAQEQSLTIEFVGLDGVLLDNVNKHVSLVSRLAEANQLRASERRRLQRSVANEVRQALEPLGYYKAQVRRDLGSPENVLRYVVELNQPVRIRSLDISLNERAEFTGDFASWRDSVDFKQGDILNQSLYESYKKTLLSQALKLGYFDASFTRSEIRINRELTDADVVLNFVTGERYKIGNVDIVWQLDEADEKSKRGLDKTVLDTLITLKEGTVYSADDVSKTQQNLLAAPFFSSAEVQLGEPDQSKLQIPIILKITPRKRRAFNLEIGAGTDTGVRGGIGFENRRINSAGHTVNARIGASEITRSVLLNYRIPKPTELIDSANVFASSSERVGGTRRYESDKIGTELQWEWQNADVVVGVEASRERSSRINERLLEVDRTTNLLVPSIGLARTKVDDVYFPSRGWSASITLRGASDALLSDIDLLQAKLDLKRLFPMGDGRLKLRLQMAGSVISEASELPESLGFLAGGDDSIRGYSFESIGVERNGETTVGKNLITMSAEYQHPIRDSLSLAVFVDAGDAFDSSADYKKGAGVGLRWRLPFGALRFDIASALDIDGDPFRLHFSFGTDL